MLIERPPLLYRWLLPQAVWRLPKLRTSGKRTAYLTFDDGPIPEVTPWLLTMLREREVRATFFCVGDNVRKYPHLFEQILAEGHTVGNHTFHHLQGLHCSTQEYIKDTEEADALIKSKLFRPPHGLLTWRQLRKLQELGYVVVMQDVVTRDYSKWMSPEETFQNVVDYARDGSIIVFHDSLRSAERVANALPRTIDYLRAQGYELEMIPGGRCIEHESQSEKRLVI